MTRTPLHAAHLFALGLWGGLVTAELIIEASARTPEEHRAAARLHHRLDLLVEVPLLAVVVATGAVLAARAPMTPLLAAKLGCALAAIAANVVCVVLVVARRRAADAGDDARVLRLAGAIRWTGAGVPFGLAALAIGAAKFF